MPAINDIETNQMKITFIIASLEGFGGTNRVATLLANGLSSYHDITILSRYSMQNTYPLNSEVKDIKFTGNNLSFLWQCKNYINNKKPDVVVIHTMSKLTPALLSIGIKSKAIWSFEHTAHEFHHLKYKILRKILYLKLSKVLTLTNNDKKHYESLTKSVAKVGNPSPLTLNNNAYKDSSKTIVSLGRLASEKGYDLLINAWSQVEPRYPKWSLHIYGEGPERNKLEKIIAINRLNNITLKGLTDDVETVYDEAAFYTMSSKFEGFGMVLIEAQNRGLPIVSFDCPSGPAEIVHHNIDGMLVENGNISALANAMIEMIENPQLRKAMASEALKSAQRYHIDKVIEEWLKLLTDT
ncbi:glycosyltransferase family 4 protein [Psychrobacter maritimus]|uniref:glycosyltransferase family 4 protein n=1 Tax=Psychrobacter maritimus TaxID=256325 RepID=UPI001918DCA6|nr:glycosyltransferase family 4 protein [Psychrobacter maritimus]